MRRLVSFSCDGDRLVGTLDEADGRVGVLIVSGGNEVRCGAHRGMATVSALLAAAGVPVLRFDRRGVGDSEGENHGWSSAASDMATALAIFRAEQPHLRRVIGFGNCDAATALLLLPHDCDTLVLANPWLGDETAATPPAAVRSHYLRRVRSLSAWRGLASSGWTRSVRALLAAVGSPRPQPLAVQVTAALRSRPTRIVLASGDRTAQVFAAGVSLPATCPVTRLDTASHSFAGQAEALGAIILAASREIQAT